MDADDVQTSTYAMPINKENAANGKGSGGIVYNNLNKNHMARIKGERVPAPKEVVLGHELAHAADYDKGVLDRSIDPNTRVDRSEKKAIRIENKIRNEMNLDPRDEP